MGSNKNGRAKRFLDAIDYDRGLEWIIRHPVIVIAVTLLITVALGWRLPQLQIRASSYEIAIKDIQATKNYEAFEKEFGGGEYIQVIAKTTRPSVFDPAVFNRLTALSEAFGKIPGVIKVVSLPDAKKDMDLLGEWSIADFERVVKPIRLFEKNLISKDRKSTAFTLLLTDLSREEQIVKAVDDILAREKGGPLTLYAIGMPIVSQALLASIKRDFMWLPPITFLVMVLTLLAFFRGSRLYRLVIPPVACDLICLVWTFGIMAWTGTPVTSLSLVVPIILIAVGTAYGLRVVAEYVRMAPRSKTREEATRLTIHYVQLPTMLTIFTFLVGFAPQLFSPMKLIRDFALPSCLGMCAFLLLILIFFPAVLVLFPLPGDKEKKAMEREPGKFDFLEKLLDRMLEFDFKHRRQIFITFALILLVGTVGLLRLQIEADTTKYFRANSPVARHFHDVYKDMAGCFPINVVLDADKSDYFRDPANLAKVADLQKYLESLPGVDKTISFADYMELINYSLNDYNPEFYTLPKDPAVIPNLLNIYKMVLGKEIARRFMREDFSKTSLLMMMHISSSHKWLETEKEILKTCKERWGGDFAVTLTSMGVVVAHSNKEVTESLVSGLLMVLVIIFIVMFILFMSPLVASIAMVPSVFPLVVVFGIMGWLRIELSMNTAMIATIAIGLAVDHTMHHLARYNNDFRKDLNKDRASREAMHSAGRAKILGTVTICLGFAVLIFSDLKPTAMFGGLLVATLSASIIGDLMVLPAALHQADFVTVWDLVRVRLGPEPVRLIPLFTGLSRFQIRTILGSGTIMDFPEGHTFTLCGPDRGFFHTILGGEVGVYYAETAQAARGGIRVATFRTGDVIADASSDRWYKESAFYVCTTPVEILMINPKNIRRLQWLYPPAASKFVANYINILAERLDRTTRTLATAGYRDDVTGLTNPVTFTHAVEIETERVRRYGGKLSVLILEVSGWKDVLRAKGFSGGDRALGLLAQNLVRQLRCYDVMCRLDDWRFAVLLVQAGPAEASSVLQRLKGFAARLMEEDLPPFNLSAGSAHFVEGVAPSAQELIARAFSELARDKKSLG